MQKFDDAGCARIEALIAELEQGTSGEVVVAVVPSCSPDLAARQSWASLLCAVGVILGCENFVAAPAYFFVLATVPLFALFAVLWGRPTWARFLLSTRQKERNLAAFAERLIDQHQLNRTREQTGILIVISLLERWAYIWGDKGIDEKLGKQGWLRSLQTITHHLQVGTGVDGLLAVLQDLRRILAEHFPPHADNQNELPNKVLRH